MFRDQFGHLEHADNFLATEDGLQVFIGVDHRPFVFVLQVVFLDVIPEFFRHLSARGGLGTYHGGESGGGCNRLHEGRIGFALFLHHFFCGYLLGRDFFDRFLAVLVLDDFVGGITIRCVGRFLEAQQPQSVGLTTIFYLGFTL